MSGWPQLRGDPRCPACGDSIDGYTPLDLDPLARPRQGAVSVCICCEVLLVWQEPGGWSLPDVVQATLLEHDEQVMAMRAFLRRFKAETGRP